MIKMYASIEELSQLPINQLKSLSEKLHIASAEDIETDPQSLFIFEKSLKTHVNIESMIQLIEEEGYSISWNYDKNNKINVLRIDDTFEFSNKELHTCLFQAITKIILEKSPV